MKIIYTYTDEAPALATESLLPIVRAFASAADVELETRDISLAGRILAQFPDRLSQEQFVADDLSELGELAKTPEANIIKLPNISASVPQLKAAVKDIAAQNGLHATFMGKPFNDQGGSGTHLHISLNRDGSNAFTDAAGDQGVSEELGHFTAGLIEHAPQLLPIHRFEQVIERALFHGLDGGGASAQGGDDDDRHFLQLILMLA